MTRDLTAEEVLTTTRSVRKRLDVDKPVPRALIEECLEIAFQAPNGSNLNSWHWVVVDDPALIRKMADIYGAGMDDFVKILGQNVGDKYVGATVPGSEKIGESVQQLREKLPRMPAIVIPLLAGRPEGANIFYQAGMWGSIVQAVWSFFLALRMHGMGSAWTTIHLHREQEMADLLGIPADRFTQVGLFPIAYTIGTDFKKAWRKPAKEVVSWNRFGAR